MRKVKSNIKWLNIILFLIVMVGLIALAQFFLLPDMEGWTIERVKIYENGNDINIVYNYKFTEAYDYGVVIAQEDCERVDPCDVILTVSKGRDVSNETEEQISLYLNQLVENELIDESQIQINTSEHSDDVNKDYAILYRPSPSEGIIEVTISLGPEIIMKEASLIAAGDVVLHASVYENFETNEEEFDFTPLFTQIKPFIKAADFAFVNQESNVGGVELELSSYPNFNSPSEIVRDLVDTGFNMFSRASPHTLDRGEEGVEAAQAIWNQFPDIITSGSAHTLQQRNRIPVIEENGIKIALLAYSQGFNDHELPEDKEYLANLFSYEEAEADIEKAKQVADLVIVSMHWGTENESMPNQSQQEQAQWLADMGVHVVLGSHPNVLQPLDVIMGVDGNETIVAYSLGKLVSEQTELEQNISGILNFDIQKITIRDEVRIELNHIHFMPTYNYFDEEDSTYRLIPLADSDQSDYFETIETLFEEFSSQIDVVQWLTHMETEEELDEEDKLDETESTPEDHQVDEE